MNNNFAQHTVKQIRGVVVFEAMAPSSTSLKEDTNADRNPLLFSLRERYALFE